MLLAILLVALICSMVFGSQVNLEGLTLNPYTPTSSNNPPQGKKEVCETKCKSLPSDKHSACMKNCADAK